MSLYLVLCKLLSIDNANTSPVMIPYVPLYAPFPNESGQGRLFTVERVG